MTKYLECVCCCSASSSSIETKILCDKDYNWCPFLCNRQCTTSYLYAHGYSMLKKICHKIIKNYNRKQCRETYTVFGGGNSTKDRPLFEKHKGNFEAYGLKNNKKYAVMENESQKKMDIFKGLRASKAKIRRGYEEDNELIISKRFTGVGAKRRGASEIENELKKNKSLEWDSRKNNQVKKKKFNEFYKKTVSKRAAKSIVDMQLNENYFDTKKYDKNNGLEKNGRHPAQEKSNKNGKFKDRGGNNLENDLPKRTEGSGIHMHLNENYFDTKKFNQNKGLEGNSRHSAPNKTNEYRKFKDRGGKHQENYLSEKINEKVTKKSKNRWRDSNYDERATKQLSPEKNQANFQIKRDPIKMHHGVKGDSDVNGRSDEQLKWDPAFNKMTLVGKNVNEATKNEDSETPFRKERKRRNTPNSDKTSQGHSSKNTDKSKAAKGVFKRGHGRYRCKSLGYMKEHLRFGRFVCPSDLLRVKLEERDLYRCIPYCNTSLYQTCMPYKFRYQCCAAP